MRTLHTRATSSASGLWQTYRHWRYAILFYSLLLTFVVGPLDSALGLRTNLLNLFLAINQLAAVAPIRGRKTRLVLLCILVVALVRRVEEDTPSQTPIITTLYDLIAALSVASAPGEEGLVTAAVARLCHTGRLRFLALPHTRVVVCA